ncbi:hypothetical protein HDV06_004110 [Boothiomyces sp. JEL0866]|nr:hypothetical protein HDV06_007091 [Boothiomyces sp. JEL0866]KAJ3321574.1 hypothetical protein HDV06_004110 [Boothiomyces sp. JEL0866]
MDLKKIVNSDEDEYYPLIPIKTQVVASNHPTPIIMKECLWGKPHCAQLFPDDQALFDHVNQVHIGRKKTDNLCLSCHWGNCNVVCTKRDHITSHIKVHIPVKPYKCKKCTRCFKRAQDLTKHQKTHEEQPIEKEKTVHKRSISIFSAVSSDTTVSSVIPDGYMSDPGIGIEDVIKVQKGDDIWCAKPLAQKRKSNMVSELTYKIKSRRLEKSIHLKESPKSTL